MLVFSRVPAETPLETSHRFLRDVYRCNFNDNTSDVINHITDSLSGWFSFHLYLFLFHFDVPSGTLITSFIKNKF